MRGRIGLATAAAAFVALACCLPSVGASMKVAYTAAIDDNHDLGFQFEERHLKGLSSVEYLLRGDAVSETPTLGALYEGLTSIVTVVPDDRNRAAGSLTLDIPSPPSPGPCGCGGLHVEYFNLLLVNLTTGRTYELDPVSRDFP